MTVAREWKHARMLKWAGRFLQEGGAADTGPGELAVACRSCPIVGVNLNADHLNRPDNMKYVHDCCSDSRTQLILFYRYLNRMHIAQDANFRLNNRAHKRGSLDRPMQPGSAYMVDALPLQRYVLSFVDEKEVRKVSILISLQVSNVSLRSVLALVSRPFYYQGSNSREVSLPPVLVLLGADTNSGVRHQG
jgi:hypothetical protein